jgi:hypothetical protein
LLKKVVTPYMNTTVIKPPYDDYAFDSKPSGENFIYMMRHSRSNAVKTRLKISRNDDDDGDDNDYYGKDDKYYYGKDGKDDKYYYGKDGDSGMIVTMKSQNNPNVVVPLTA